jgi:hypothetical protein
MSRPRAPDWLFAGRPEPPPSDPNDVDDELEELQRRGVDYTRWRAGEPCGAYPFCSQRCVDPDA